MQINKQKLLNTITKTKEKVKKSEGANKIYYFTLLCSLNDIYTSLTSENYIEIEEYIDEYTLLSKLKKEIINNQQQFYNKNINQIYNISKNITSFKKELSYPQNIHDLISLNQTKEYVFEFLDTIDNNYRQSIEKIWETNIGYAKVNRCAYSVFNDNINDSYIVLGSNLLDYNKLCILIHELGHLYESYLYDFDNTCNLSTYLSPLDELTSTYFERKFIDYISTKEKEYGQAFMQKYNYRTIEFMKLIYLAINNKLEIDNDGDIDISYNKLLELKNKDSIDYNPNILNYNLYKYISYGFSNLICNYINDTSNDEINNNIINDTYIKKFKHYSNKASKTFLNNI